MTPGLTTLWLAWREGGLRRPVLVAVTAGGFSAFWVGPAAADHCGGHGHASGGMLQAQCASFALFEWMLMVAAMMTPLIVPTLNHVWHSSLAHRRFDSLVAIGLGYGACWAVAGIVLMPAAAALGQGWGAAFAILALAVAWSCSPIAQYARNRCHRVRGINPFGLAADRDSFVQGVVAGGPCVLACWPWMLVPMAAPGGHLALTAAVTLVLFLERLAEPRRPAWRAPAAVETIRLLLPRRERTIC